MDDILKQAEQYRTDVTYNGRAHYKAADIASKWQNRLGIPVVVTTSIVGTSIFATINSNPGVGWKIGAGTISLLAAVLASLQTFFKFSELAEKHRIAGANYGAARREIDIFNLQYTGQKDSDRSAALEHLQKIASNLSRLASESPRVPDNAFKLAIKEIEGKLPTSVNRIHDGK